MTKKRYNYIKSKSYSAVVPAGWESAATSVSARKKEKVFSVTAADCIFDVFRGSGKGGQKRNKTSSGVRCRHLPSGAYGEAEDAKEQSLNRKNAFIRMTECPEFRVWLELETDKLMGLVTTEFNDGKGNWVKET